jgi:hypothetical protein
MLWRIYYANGATFDSAQGGPEDASPTGVICIKQRNAVSAWALVSLKDYYLWHHGAWWGADTPGFWQYLFKPGAKVALFGESVPDAKFNEIVSRAVSDPDFGEKSAVHLLEKERSWS